MGRDCSTPITHFSFLPIWEKTWINLYLVYCSGHATDDSRVCQLISFSIISLFSAIKYSQSIKGFHSRLDDTIAPNAVKPHQTMSNPATGQATGDKPQGTGHRGWATGDGPQRTGHRGQATGQVKRHTVLGTSAVAKRISPLQATHFSPSTMGQGRYETHLDDLISITAP